MHPCRPMRSSNRSRISIGGCSNHCAANFSAMASYERMVLRMSVGPPSGYSKSLDSNRADATSRIDAMTASIAFGAFNPLRRSTIGPSDDAATSPVESGQPGSNVQIAPSGPSTRGGMPDGPTASTSARAAACAICSSSGSDVPGKADQRSNQIRIPWARSARARVATA